MPQNSNKRTGANSSTTQYNASDLLRTSLHLLLLDIIVYGWIVPALGTYVGGKCAGFFEISPKWEVLLVMMSSLIFMYTIFYIFGEASYWKHLFAFKSTYTVVLRVRDITNIIICIACVYGISSTVQIMVNTDKGMKSKHDSEGVIYVFLKNLCKLFHVNPIALKNFGLSPITGKNDAESEKFERGAAYMLYWSMLTTSVSKLVYFNTLFTYLRAMEIFISMNPSFPEDHSPEGSVMALPHGYKSISPTGRLQNDLADSVRRVQSDDN